MTQPQTSRYDTLFEQLAQRNEGAFIPFVTLGDPTIEQSFAIIKTLIDAGADALELGIPFSDPSADGVTIQLAGQRALSANVTVDQCFALLAQVRQYNATIPIGLLVYGNLIFARGLTKFYQDCAIAGVDSVLVADLPLRESQPFREAAKQANIATIFIAPPNASDEKLAEIAKYSTGYTYVLARAGVTGVNTVSTTTNATNNTEELINKLTQFNAAPAIIGFGISTPDHVKAALSAGASGAISGSATVKIIEENLSDTKKLHIALADFVTAMKAATR
jgi:tryptophan synthase alpha chain